MGAGVAVVGVGVMYTLHMVDRSMNYQTVPGRVASLEITCSLEKTGFRKREWTDSRSCDVIEAAQAEDPQYKDWTIKRETTADIAYISPADHAEHHGTLSDRTSGAREGFGGKHEGELINILAHTSNADKIQKL
jgi:hypothetical protein